MPREKDPLAVKIGKRLRSLRTRAGYMKPDDFAKKAGLEPGTYGQYERGWALPPVDTLLVIADALGVTPNDVLERRGRDELTAEERELISTLRQYETPTMRESLLEDARRRLETERKVRQIYAPGDGSSS